MVKDTTQLHNIYKTKLSCGKNLLELTTYNDISLWWMVHPIFFNMMHNDFPSPPRQICFFLKIYKIIGPFAQIFYDILICAIVRLLLITALKNKKHSDRKIIFLTQNVEWRTDKKTDIFFDSVMNELWNDGFNILSTYPIAIWPRYGLKICIDKIKNFKAIHYPNEKYYNLDTLKEYISSIVYFKRAWVTLCNDATFRTLCTDNGFDHQKVMTHLEIYFIFLFPYIVKEYGLDVHLLKKEKPLAVVMQNEYGWIAKSLLVAAKIESIPVIAIQHGIIHLKHTGYIYEKDEISFTKIKSPYCPIPNITAVYGEYYYDLLTKKSSYPSNSVIVTGQPRYDKIFYASNIYNKEKFYIKNNIQPDHKILLWTTQLHGNSDKENDDYLNYIFKLINDLKNVTLVIKQHPAEHENYTHLIMEHMNRGNNKNIILMPKDADTYELIYICDILITKTSTTAVEAAALQKPVVVFDLSDDVDEAGYVREGIAVGVFRSNELIDAILDLLKHPSTLSVAQQKYVMKHLYKIDGLSSRRVANLIVREIK